MYASGHCVPKAEVEILDSINQVAFREPIPQ